MDFVLKYHTGAGCKLWVPLEFAAATVKEKKEAVGRGGCGPGKVGDKWVPDTIYGLDVQPACENHDLSWHVAVTHEDRVLSDCMFQCNLLLLNDRHSRNKLIRWWRLRAPFGVQHYYMAVAYFGNGPA